jgi:ssDNA-binding Zn-finger/Zn-ribbon topoisomerase 1
MNEQTLDVATVPQNTAVTRAPDAAMGIDDILAQVKLIQTVMGKVMQEGEHYGKIPGCGNRSTLLQPGAQKLTMTFRLAPEYQIQETNYDRGHKEYRVICTLKSIASGHFVGQGVGCCSTLESKYRWKGGARRCPECGKETIIKGKAEYGGGWLCFAKKGGCGAKWPDGAAEIEGQSVDKVEHDSPADFYNTVLKMAKKRAFVDATITATAASDIFTQDIGDDDGNVDANEPPKTPQDAPRTAPPRTPAQPKKAAATPQGATAAPAPAKKDVDAKFDTRAFLTNCRNRLLVLVGPDSEWAWWKYAQDKSWILPNESLADATADKMFDGYDPKDVRGSVAALFDAHCTAVNAMTANCPPEFQEEVKRGWVAMPRTAAGPSAPSAAPKTGNTCPACSSTATKKHEDLAETTWCQKCGVMWGPDRTPFEEHEWMEAKLPFAPKDTTKPYKGMTLGRISRLDSKYWFGVVMNYKAEPYMGRPPSAEAVKFGEACEAARQHLKNEAGGGEGRGDEDDELPM